MAELDCDELKNSSTEQLFRTAITVTSNGCPALRTGVICDSMPSCESVQECPPVDLPTLLRNLFYRDENNCMRIKVTR